ncbi:hypothetical protein [Roseovarius sp.]|uniref:hypothetical protein n=1 Tax=Roseovarius sp. TaxID=1486281 RepID=UPI0035636B76
MLIAKGHFEGQGGHEMRGSFRIEEDTDGKIWFTTSDDFFFDGSPAPGFAVSASGDLTAAEAAATDFLRLSGTGSGTGAQLEVHGAQRAEIPATAGIKIAKAVFLWCYIFPSVLGVGEIEHV